MKNIIKTELIYDKIINSVDKWSEIITSFEKTLSRQVNNERSKANENS